MSEHIESDQAAQMFRVFIALPTPPAVQEELKRARSELRSQLSNDAARWTRPEQIHLTLSFLGNVVAGQVNNLIAATTAACDSFAPIPLSAEDIGFFPSKRRPRVIWCAVHDNTGELRRLQTTISHGVASFAGGPDEKKFSPHLTLGRVRHLTTPELEWLAETVRSMKSRSFGAWTADKVEIVRSELGSEGSRYTCLAEIALRRQIEG